MDFLHEEALFGFTYLQVLGIAIVGLAVLWVISKVRSPSIKSEITKKRCTGCNWSGPAGKSTVKCPSCGGLLKNA